MAALSCEICGGKLVGKPGGIFECDSCGMEYSTEWARAKVQEIKGTVKVEGTVEVQGTVKVEGGVSVENLLRRGFDVLEDGKFAEGKTFFQRALEIDPDCGDAFLGLAITEANYCRTVDKFWEGLVKHHISEPQSFKKIRRAKLSDALAERLKAYDDVLTEEENALALRKRAGAENSEEYRIKREQAFRAKGMSTGEFFGWFLDVDGKLFCNDSDLRDLVEEIDFTSQEYCDIVQICDGGSWMDVICLRADGSVFELHPVRIPAKLYGERDSYRIERRDIFDKEERIVQVLCEHHFPNTYAVCGLRDSGTIASLVNYPYDRKESFLENVASLSGITRLFTSDGYVYALREDGTASNINTGKDCPAEDIAAIAYEDPVYLHTDGTLSAPTANLNVRYEILQWADIIDISCFDWNFYALRIDGTVLSISEYGEPKLATGITDIVALADNMGIKADGTVIDLESGKPVMEELKLFNNIKTLEQEQREAGMRRKEKAQKVLREKIAVLKAEKASLESQLANLKGLFSGGKRSKLEARLAEIQKQLNELEE